MEELHRQRRDDAELDLVISVDTALAHLAGALARPLWCCSGPTPTGVAAVATTRPGIRPRACSGANYGEDRTAQVARVSGALAQLLAQRARGRQNGAPHPWGALEKPMQSATAVALAGFIAWTLFLLVLMEAMRTKLVVTRKWPQDGSCRTTPTSRLHARLARAHAELRGGPADLGRPDAAGAVHGQTAGDGPLAYWFRQRASSSPSRTWLR